MGQSRRFRDAPDESGPPPITDISCQRLIISVAAWAYQRRCRLCCRPVPRCAATLPIAHRYSCPAPPRRASSTPYRFPLAGARFHPARADRDLPAAFLGAAAFAQGVLQGLSSDDPVRFGPFPSRYRCRFRLIFSQCLHHRDMRHHRITAMLADQHQQFGSRLPLRRLLFGFGQLGDVKRGVAEREQRLAARLTDRIGKLLSPRHEWDRGCAFFYRSMFASALASAYRLVRTSSAIAHRRRRFPS
jgi:hypothetical protein